MNWWAITAISMWVCATISNIYKDNVDAFGYALAGNFLLGLFYLLLLG